MFDFWKKKGVEAAETTLTNYGKVNQAIVSEGAKLQTSIAELHAAGIELRDSEVAEALGEQPAVSSARARKRLADAKTVIDTHGRRMEGLRNRLMALAGEAPVANDKLLAELPSISAAIEADFRKEWADAAVSFSKVLGKRTAIEKLLGTELALPAPSPALTELDAEIRRPYEHLAALRTAINNAVSAHAATRSEREVDPYKVYRLKRAVRGSAAGEFPEGALVVAASFPEGRLAHLIELDGWVAPVKDPAATTAAHAARRAQLKMEADVKERHFAEHNAVAMAEAAETNAWIAKNFPESGQAADARERDWLKEKERRETEEAKPKHGISYMKEPVRLDAFGKPIEEFGPVGPPAGVRD